MSRAFLLRVEVAGGQCGQAETPLSFVAAAVCRGQKENCLESDVFKSCLSVPYFLYDFRKDISRL